MFNLFSDTQDGSYIILGLMSLNKAYVIFIDNVIHKVFISLRYTVYIHLQPSEVSLVFPLEIADFTASVQNNGKSSRSV